MLPGQQASGGQNTPLQVKGSGDLQPIKNTAGKIVTAVPASAASEAAPPPAAAPAKSAPASVWQVPGYTVRFAGL